MVDVASRCCCQMSLSMVRLYTVESTISDIVQQGGQNERGPQVPHSCLLGMDSEIILLACVE